MSSSEIEILRHVFGYCCGPVASPPMKYRFSGFHKRIEAAAKKLQNLGLVVIKPASGERMYEVVPAYAEFQATHNFI